MSTPLDAIRDDIAALHAFFEAWFNGSADPVMLDAELVARLDPAVVFISPEGHVLDASQLINGFKSMHSSNPNFRIGIRDVAIRQDLGAHILATYTEWQIGATASEPANNARLNTVLMTKSAPFRWLHVHETWLPAALQDAEAFNF